MFSFFDRLSAPSFAVIAVAAILAVPAASLILNSGAVSAAETAVTLPPPALDETGKTGSETAILAGGCFWGVQGVFQHVKGVTKAVSGYSGGTAKDPTYHQVGSGDTGHAESVEVTFDPAVISYGKILQIFFSVAHDPTQLNRQGPDWGTQYRSAIFTTTPEQKKIADAYVAQLDQGKLFPQRIVTEIKAAGPFYAAEDYHQDYATLHPDQLYIVYNDLPKIANLKANFPEVWRDKPVLVFAANGT